MRRYRLPFIPMLTALGDLTYMGGKGYDQRRAQMSHAIEVIAAEAGWLAIGNMYDGCLGLAGMPVDRISKSSAGYPGSSGKGQLIPHPT